MSKALIVRTTGAVEVKDLVVGDSYNLISGAVGGWIECVSLPTLGVDMWVNEEGKLIGLPVNTAGTALWESEYGRTDIIVGDIIITGGVDDEGDTLGLTEEAIESLTRQLR